MEDYKKKYEEALENIKKIKAANKDNNELVDFIEYKYPELKESEDEKIGKWIKRELESKYVVDNIVNNEMADKALAWLEKQVEQTITDKVEPKFKIGDWVVWDNKISCHVDNIYQGKESLMYTITDIHNMTRSYSVKGFDNNTHFWTIQDAKDGDVLVASDDSIFLFKCTVGCACKHYVALETDGSIKFNKGLEHVWENSKTVHPATKEQRDLLFNKMKEAGYEWDVEKKELKKIEQKPVVIIPKFHEGDVIKPKDGGHEPWKIMQVDISDKKYRFKDGYVIHFSQEDDYELVEQKPTWSEEDERLQQCLIRDQEKCLEEVKNDKVGHSEIISDLKEMYRERIDWLKSLKERYTWKPNDEQMKQLGWVAEQNKDNMLGKELMSLYQDLKRLREE